MITKNFAALLTSYRYLYRLSKGHRPCQVKWGELWRRQQNGLLIFEQATFTLSTLGVFLSSGDCHQIESVVKVSVCVIQSVGACQAGGHSLTRTPCALFSPGWLSPDLRLGWRSPWGLHTQIATAAAPAAELQLVQATSRSIRQRQQLACTGQCINLQLHFH